MIQFLSQNRLYYTTLNYAISRICWLQSNSSVIIQAVCPYITKACLSTIYTYTFDDFAWNESLSILKTTLLHNAWLGDHSDMLTSIWLVGYHTNSMSVHHKRMFKHYLHLYLWRFCREWFNFYPKTDSIIQRLIMQSLVYADFNLTRRLSYKRCVRTSQKHV